MRLARSAKAKAAVSGCVAIPLAIASLPRTRSFPARALLPNRSRRLALPPCYAVAPVPPSRALAVPCRRRSRRLVPPLFRHRAALAPAFVSPCGGRRIVLQRRLRTWIRMLIARKGTWISRVLDRCAIGWFLQQASMVGRHKVCSSVSKSPMRRSAQVSGNKIVVFLRT
uniref:Uncharacterized protein n=1 Tax=Oryza sativa subsp. japonica TaxID=39947 RepID=Q69RP0_ORYSJ|nr:hypothetical protein [Oryza sativa Japonica Group]